MHHVLTIPELVRVIVDEAGYGLLCPNAPTLVALALTCRGFFEPALDVLWSKQYRLDNLVKCLPEAIWLIPSGSPKTLTLSEPTRPTTQQDWDRFDFYAKRIRALELDSLFLHKTGTRTLSKSLFRWLFSSRPSYHPLPTLTSLIWHGAESSEIRDYAHLLFGRQLSRLSIDTCSFMDSNSQTSEVPALLHLPERSPDIQELRLTTRRGFSVQPITGKFFASLKRLKFLTMESTMTEIPDILIGLSTLQNLTTVSLELSGRHRVGTSQKDEDRTGSGVVFRTLTKLTLRTATMSDANDILKTCRCPQLQLINVHGGTAQSADLEALNTMIRLINKHCVPTVLEAIEISAGEADEGTQVVQHITAASLRPLYDFHRLRSLHVISGADMYIILDDDSIEEMARSWPRIESLALWSDAATPWTTQTAMTLEGLVHLARYCPSLETLQIDVNTTGTTVSPLAKPGGGHYNRVLRELLAPRSHASGEPAYIAAFLYAIFPNLECINQGEDTDQVGEVRL
ncbi:hypothetical protein EVJ58_g10306 [Rhodofomes roseus]|uniref:F-box domain-containing protein n=1 Tax=Rhodofomes roseus TaxID=34475 RepID=A0A4Y9XNM8_9APHY|nr:hypothetical protein EVJ58_g10306 [Rhodofomes roseus]